ncbi:tetratricopeptide repeat protein [Sphaerisporangium sp. TRM90804]|uniref:tetratricopeptide repeat protein n=1 Tax=Sphaerisporangium sp. TRM90804 TaxID=3031113 RepID=UPI00244AF821|nr:tetratricopeptide repeat protein [Sphaerisporangium sp. TRM90804]MDH2425062.1 tetratricopeptide repeat protein [Sphaerisporangium sp. TRM90804]
MNSPLVVFVAMPGSNMGDHATLKEVAKVKKFLYDPVVARLENELGVEVELRIEKDKYSGGVIYRSMFGEALEAPVYIADLTGANANVYLELGVRWALRDNVTVLVCQSVEHDVKFNVAANRVIPYGIDPGQLQDACARIVRAILDGIEKGHPDSPVREGAGVISVSKAELDQLRADIARLHEERGDELVAAAMNATHEDRVMYLKRALENNPVNFRAQLHLGMSLSKAGDYETAIAHLGQAVSLVPDDGPAWRELGVAQSRSQKLDDAIESFERAVAIDPSDADALSSLGGVFRRKSRNFYDRTGDQDWVTLRDAREAYARAEKINSKDTYPLINVAKLDLLLSRGEPDGQASALARFQDLEDLTRYTAKTEGEKDPWKWLDLADTLAVNGDGAGAVKAAQRGINSLEPAHRASSVEAALPTLRDLVVTNCLPADRLPSVQQLIGEYEKHLR